MSLKIKRWVVRSFFHANSSHKIKAHMSVLS